MPDTEPAAPRKPEPAADPRILGHLLLVQSTLHVMPRAEGIAAFVCRGVTSVPGIGAAGLCLEGVLHGKSDGFPAAACDATLCRSGSGPLGATTETPPCLEGREHWIRLGLQTLSRRFGWLLLIVESREDSAPYLPHLQNLANVAAMTLESREHQAQLERLNANLRLHAAEAEKARVQLAAAHQGLEEKIHIRTAELALANRTLMEEIQERRAAEAASKESEQRLRLAQQAAHLGMWDWDFATGYVRWSEGQAALYGFPVGTGGASIQQIREKMLPEDLASTIEITNLAIRERLDYDTEFRVTWADGSIHWLMAKGRATYDENGRPVRMLGVNMDVTVRHQLEERLLQSQKMEGLGRLAGGVAHDINNMLGVMFAHLDLLEVKLPPDSPLSDHLREMGKAAERSRDIVRQLLAFSRKEVIQPKVLILEDRIGVTLKALAALLGEDIELHFHPCAEPWMVRGDPSQLDQILINLAVNARDAMPHGGRLSIQTEKRSIDEDYCLENPGFTPGEYVLLAVSDEGVGMDSATLQRVFEPFFTTKEVGKGTGLGLSTVFGIVKQHGGFVTAYSEPGHGATFKVYLPRHLSPGDAQPFVPDAPPEQGSGTVLLVEDNETLRNVILSMLQSLGYEVLAADSPQHALDICQRRGEEVDLLLTDLVMPGMSGAELRDQILVMRPCLQVLFMSGYTGDVITRMGMLEGASQFLQKPFSRQELSRKITQALAGV